MKRSLNKDIRKSITSSLGRFFSIMLLIALGSFALIGLTISGSNMRKTTIHYFNKYNTADITILSDYGLDDTEINEINKISGIKEIEYLYLKDVVEKDTNISYRILSNTENISEYEVVKGRLPKKEDEISLDTTSENYYKIGDSITFTEESDITGNKILKNKTFKIVGFINSTDILSTLSRGETLVGTGSLNHYAVVTKDAFETDVYMMAKIIFDDTYNLDPYSDEYNSKILKHKEEIEESLTNTKDIRFSLIKSEYKDKINDATTKINDAKKELNDAKSSLNKAKNKITTAKKQILNNTNKLNNANKQIKENEKLLNEKTKELNSKKEELSLSKDKLNEAYESIKYSESELGKARKTLDESENLLSQKEEELNTKSNELSKSKEELSSKKQELTTQKDVLESAKNKYEASLEELDKNINYLTSILDNPNLSEEEKTLYNEQLNTLKETKTNLTKEYNDFINNTYTPGINSINKGLKQIESKEAEISIYETEIENAKKELESARTELNQKELLYNKSYEELENYKKVYNENVNKYNEALDQIKEAEASLILAKETLNEKKSEYNKGVKTLNDAKKELETKEKEYYKKLDEYNEKLPDALSDIDDAEDKLKDAEKNYNNLETPTYQVDNRREVPGGTGYDMYETVSNIVDFLGNIFPWFMYFVAALVTLTTMTRFVDEERINMGTLKALGYKDKDVIKKFAIYGFIASSLGATIGITLGHIIIPNIVYGAYNVGFSVPKIELHFYPKETIIAIILSLLCSVVPAIIVAKKNLREKPSMLLLPKAPANGSKILLERIKFIWKKLNFTQKVTARNIFRYKKRMLMTIFGVAGSCAIIFAGFSVQHSISTINDKQFKEIIKYEMIVAENNTLDETETKELNDLLNSDSINDKLKIYYESVYKIAGKKNDTQEINLVVIDEDNYNDFIYLRDRKTGSKIELDDEGVVISERLNTLLNVKIGDTITYKDSEGTERKVKVSNICEMYAGHFMFMTKNEYKNIYNKEYSSNAYMISLKDKTMSNTETVSSEFMKLSGVKGVIQNTTLYNQINTIVDSLNRIMVILIAISSALAVVILFNLTNINVEERVRELSTIKVLGFRDNEVTMYIYRETIILSELGIIAGYLFGMFLHNYILTVVPPDQIMFDPSLWFGAYLIPLVVINIVTLLLKFYVNKKLINVDMIEALKSVD